MHRSCYPNVKLFNAGFRRTEWEKIVISCPLTTIEISKISGTSRETVSGVLKQLKNDSIVTILDKNYNTLTYFEEISM